MPAPPARSPARLAYWSTRYSTSSTTLPNSPLAANSGANWPTFGGGPDRSGRVAVRLAGKSQARPTWDRDLPQKAGQNDFASVPPARPPYCHPVIVNGHVFVTDGAKVISFNLSTGTRSGELELVQVPEALKPVDASPTLSAFGDRLFIRTGPAAIRPHDRDRPAESAIGCIQVIPQPDGTCDLKTLWQIRPPSADDKSPVFWEGTQSWMGGGCGSLTAISRPVASSTASPAMTLATPQLPPNAPPGPLTFAMGQSSGPKGESDTNCSRSRAAMWCSARIPARSWHSMPRPASTPGPFDMPGHIGSIQRTRLKRRQAVWSAGRLFVAPADADRVYALDPNTGERVWQSEPTEGAAILGVSSGRLVVTTQGLVKGIRGLDLETGRYQAPGWIQGDGGGLLNYGRGFVTDDLIVWPTRAGLLFLRSSDGLPIRGEPLQSPLPGSLSRYFGNVVYADGVIVVVTPTQLWGYVSEARRFGPADPQSVRDPIRREFERLIERTESAPLRATPPPPEPLS